MAGHIFMASGDARLFTSIFFIFFLSLLACSHALSKPHLFTIVRLIFT